MNIYESETLNSTVASKDIFQFEMLKNSSITLLGLNILCTEGIYINGKTDDDDVYATMMGYYIPTT